MGIKLRDLIRQVRACKTQAEERETVAKECANIRTAMKSADNAERHQSVAKLLFIHMLGYPTHFGQVECLKLIASQTFPEKRMGYLGLMAMVDERHEVLMLVTNSIKQDMNHANPYIAGLALCALGNLASPEMARDLQNEVERQLKTSSNPYIQKKVFLVALRSIRKVPDLLPIYLPYVKQSLTDKNPSIVLVGLALAMEMIQIKPKLKKKFAKYVDTLVKYLKNMITSGYSPDRDVGGINDPFLQVRIIKFLCIVGEGNAEASEQMNDVLAQVATNTEPSKNPGNAILYECVKTVMSIEAESGLRVMAVNILGRFLLNRDNNIRYVALNTLCQSVKQNIQAIQRHRNTIVECLKDSDVSIRARALDLIYCLVNRSNVESLVYELVTYLQSPNTEKDFRSDLTSRVTEVVERFAPNPKWHINTLIEILKISGNVTKLKVPFRLAMLITDNPNLRPYAVFTLYKAFTADQSQANLVIVSLWAFGEFGDILTQSEGASSANAECKSSSSFAPISEATLIASVRDCLGKSANPPSLIKQYCLMALLKFSVRFPSSEAEIAKILAPHRSSISTELQARACEFSVLLEDQFSSLRPPTLANMPAITKKPTIHEELVGEIPDEGPEKVELDSTEPTSTSSAPSSSSPLDLLGLDMGMGSGPAAPVKVQGNPVDLLADIFGSSMASPTNAQQSATSSAMPFDMFASGTGLELNNAPTPSFPDVEAFNQSGIKVVFGFEPIKCPGGQFRINATFSSSRPDDIEQFEFKAAVPKYIRIRLNPASGSTLYGEGRGSAIQQQIEVINTTPDKPLLMKIKIDGIANGTPISETGQINEFPVGL